MRVVRYIILLCVAIVSGALSAQSQRELGRLMRDREEYYFTLSLDHLDEIQAISKLCSVDGTDGKTVVCYANPQQYDKLLKAGYQPTLQTPPSLRANVTMWNGQGTYNWDAYLTYSQYVTMMEGFPSLALSDRSCTLLDLGTLSTANHRRMLGVRINNGQPEGKPKFLYSSTMHGDEITGMILMLRLIDELCTSTDPRIVNLVDNLDIYIFPNTNPDGTYYGGNNTVNGARRANANGVDLNRHFKDFVYGDHPDGASSYQSEAQWMMDFGLANLFTMSANYHGGAELMNYPYDCTTTYPADAAWWEYVCSEYVSLARQVHSSYMTSTYSSGVTNGAAWYMVGGGRQDFMNYYAECREVTIECSTTKTPSASLLPNFWNYNHNSMLAFMEQCLNGVHGHVCDAATKEPLQGVTVAVQNYDTLGSSVTTHAVGDFHRPIKGGTYTLVFSKEGYDPQSVKVVVSDGQRLDLDTVFLVSPWVQNVMLSTGWNWWVANVDLDGATLLDMLTTGLGTHGIRISSQDGQSLTYSSTYGVWMGSLTALEQGKMYKIETDGDCNFTLSGPSIAVENLEITLSPGLNWIGFFGTQNMGLTAALQNLTPAAGDIIASEEGLSATYYNAYGWVGSLSVLEPGKAYTYKSNATTDKTFTYPSSKITN